MNRLLKLFAKLTLSMMLGMILLSSCELQPDDEILDDITAEINDKTTDETNTKKK